MWIEEFETILVGEKPTPETAPFCLAVTPIREITDKSDIGFEKALQIITEARKLVQADWMTAKELWDRRKAMLRCSTGSQKLDTLLAGGHVLAHACTHRVYIRSFQPFFRDQLI